jgi:hypothetical protein
LTRSLRRSIPLRRCVEDGGGNSCSVYIGAH